MRSRPCSRVLYLRTFAYGILRMTYRSSEGRKQVGRRHGLIEERHRMYPLSLRTHGGVDATRHEDGRRCHAPLPQLGHDFEAVVARQIHVQDHTSAGLQVAARKQLIAARERVNGVAARFQKELQRFPNRNVVFNYVDQ